MATGRLSTTEKYAIQGMLHDGKTITDIEQTLNRTKGNAVKNYITKELDQIIETITKVRLSKALNGDDNAFYDADVEETEDNIVNPDTGNKEISAKEAIQKKLEQENNILIPEEMTQQTERLLRGAEMPKNQIVDIMRRTRKRLKRAPIDAKEFFSLCIQTLNANDMMISEAKGGRTGVKVMTQTASMALDEAKKKAKSKNISRSARGNMFNPKTEETY